MIRLALCFVLFTFSANAQDAGNKTQHSQAVAVAKAVEAQKAAAEKAEQDRKSSAEKTWTSQETARIKKMKEPQ